MKFIIKEKRDSCGSFTLIYLAKKGVSLNKPISVSSLKMCEEEGLIMVESYKIIIIIIIKTLYILFPAQGLG